MKAISRFLFVSMMAMVLAACNSSGGPPRDITAPVITLTDDNPQILAMGEAYVELGATASDNRDGDLTASIVINTSSVDPGTPGDYTVTYNVTDAAGNAAVTMTRTVTVLPPVPEQAEVSVEGDIKQLVFSWNEVQYTHNYRLMENADGHSGFSQLGNDIPADTLAATQDIAVHLFDWANAQYLVEACNVTGCSSSDIVTVTDVMLHTIGYFKASNTDPGDLFGRSVALSGDGHTLAVAAGEDSCATGLDGNEEDNSCEKSGAVYLFRSGDSGWYQEAYIKASNTQAGDGFGTPVLSADGNTLTVCARGEDSCATGINGAQDDNSCEASGAAYVFRFGDNGWYQEAYIKASNTDEGDSFGEGVALSDDGNTLAVGAWGEDSSATGINGDQADDSLTSAGAVYLFRYDHGAWHQDAYIKASNTGVTSGPPLNGSREPVDAFGTDVALSANGDSLVVAGLAGVYMFHFDGSMWHEQEYFLWAPRGLHDDGDHVGDLDVDADGNTFAVSRMSWFDGLVFVYRFENDSWYRQAAIQTPEFDASDHFGITLALNGTGDALVVGAPDYHWEGLGTVYLFGDDGQHWSLMTSVRASNYEWYDHFGGGVALSADAETLAVGTGYESSASTGIGGDQDDNSAIGAGAVYVY